MRVYGWPAIAAQVFIVAACAATVGSSETRTVVIGPQYRASGFHRWLFGSDYRDLWTQPIEVEVLDVDTFAGGLTPVRRVGGQQTKGLALKGADGRDYTFRSLDKDPSDLLPDDLLGTYAQTVVRDQGAAQHPVGALAADPLMEAVGVLHAHTRLVVMPDSERLGEYRKDFANVAGTIAEFPGAVSATNPGFRGATAVVKHKDLYARLEASPDDRVDERAFLRARLLDLLMGDWDRHRDQWRWARLPESPLWQPIAEDRDQAFSRYEGLILDLVRDRQGRLQKFGNGYGNLTGWSWNGREQDRFILRELDAVEWKKAAQEVQAAVTDAVIDAAVAALPREYAQKDGARLSRALRSRRDRLPDAALRFYRLLSHEADVYLTNVPEQVDVDRSRAGQIEVRVSRLGPDGTLAEPYFRRVFRADETREVRLYLRGGDDRVVSHGTASGIVVRAVGGDGLDTVDDSQGGGTKFYDTEGRATAGADTRVDRRPYTPPPGPPNAPWVPARDWGREWYGLTWVSYGSDLGVFLGAGFDRRRFGFRDHPYASRQVFRAGWAFGASTFRADYHAEFRRSNSGVRTTLKAYASGIETLRFYGFGNETKVLVDEDHYKVEQTEYLFRPSIDLPVVSKLRFSIGPEVKYATSDLTRGQLIALLKPYGSDDFGQVGAHAALDLDARDHPVTPAHGVHLGVAGTFYPGLWDVEKAFGAVEGDAGAYLTPGFSHAPTLALHVGGRQVFGKYPFHEAAYIGGQGGEYGPTVRGFRTHRFAGDGSLYGNAELRLRLTRFTLLLPADFGVHAFGDIGRVYLEGEESDVWHDAWGGGIWFAFLDRNNTITASFAHSEQRTAYYVGAGFKF